LNKNKREDKGHITRGRYCKLYTVFQGKMVWSGWKNAKPRHAKKDCNRYNGSNKWKMKTT